jgi:BolA protein
MAERAELPARMRALLADLQAQRIEIEDQSAAHAGHAGARSGGHYGLTVVSAAFAGCSRVQRHRMVYERLAALMAGSIHALTMQLLTPEEEQSPLSRRAGEG